MKRTLKETIEMFKVYQNEFEKAAREEYKKGNIKMSNFYSGRAESYENCIFELEHNLAE